MSNQDKKCFIVTPIGGDNTDVRRAAEGVIDAVIIPCLIELGFAERNIAVAHRMPNPGSINKQILKRIIEDDLVITNLTTLNPNVMYELAVRHAVRKPVVQICENGTRLPFDIIEERTIFYTNDMLGVVQLKEKFISIVTEALKDEKPDNPIFRVVETLSIESNASVSDVDKLVLERLDRLESVITKDDKAATSYQKRKSPLTKIEITGVKTEYYDKAKIEEIMQGWLTDYITYYEFSADDKYSNVTLLFSVNADMRLVTEKEQWISLKNELELCLSNINIILK